MPSAAAARAARPRRLPQRTCVACGNVTGKRDLTRVVRTPGGSVEADPTGKKAGRGAYICSRLECWEAAVAKRRLERSLKTPLSPEDAKALREFAAGLSLSEAPA